MKQVLKDSKIQRENLIKLFCKNKCTVDITHNHVQHDYEYHIRFDFSLFKQILSAM